MHYRPTKCLIRIPLHDFRGVFNNGDRRRNVPLVMGGVEPLRSLAAEAVPQNEVIDIA